MTTSAILQVEAFKKLGTSDSESMDMVLQYLSQVDDKFAILSDGKYFGQFAVVKSRRSLLKTAKENDVLKVTVQHYKNMLVLLEFSIQNTSVRTKIGDPIDLKMVVNGEYKYTANDRFKISSVIYNEVDEEIGDILDNYRPK